MPTPPNSKKIHIPIPYPPTSCTNFICSNCGKNMQIDGNYLTNKDEMEEFYNRRYPCKSTLG